MALSSRTVLIGFLAYTLIGLVFAAQFYLYLSWFGQPVTWGLTLKWMLGSWYLWALINPAILWLVRRIPLTRANWPSALATHLVAGTLAAVFHVVAYATWTWAFAPLGVGPPGWRGAVQYTFVTGFVWDLFCYAAIAAVFYALENARRYRATQMRAAQLEVQLVRAQVETLRMQLQPHFLFNTLNTIAALIPDDPRGAEQMVTRLGELLRMALDKSRDHLIPLREELEFVQKYLEIQRVRFGDRLDVRIDASQDALSAEVPTFVLQPVVENAILHGLSSESRSCAIEIRARLAADGLRIEVRDNGPGLAQAPPAPIREGIGVANIRARLQHVYGGRARLDLENGAPAGCVVSMQIPQGREFRVLAGTERA